MQLSFQFFLTLKMTPINAIINTRPSFTTSDVTMNKVPHKGCQVVKVASFPFAVPLFFHHS